MYSLGAITFAVHQNGDDVHDDKSLAFAAIWYMLLVLMLSIGGTLVMRKFQSPLAVGFFIGTVVLMSLNFFVMCVLFCGAASKARKMIPKGDVHSSEAAAVFSFLLFSLYAVFAVVIVQFRDIIIRNEENAQNHATPVEPKTLESSSSSSIPAILVRGPELSSTVAPPVSV